ncbi:hypothetical protein AURANDRAFT_65647 [Aureococcus anophagefferens]|nr:hypothetical protein AURANDRAFT_65647 [Aureococcus anophagefferens]EGB06445.1 hypothetical protein AURANDRAFT_65647 [Aureococcus anophagefferens]|eukprot:XP_009039016.1 hypothetical protein AURANDRAFT_65647 [Aureococcus anophagefferens]
MDALVAGLDAMGVDGAAMGVTDALLLADPALAAGAAAAAAAAMAASRALPLDGLLGAPSFPKIYESWFGDDMAGAMRAGVGAGLRSGLQFMEVRTQPVPNLEEAKFGTPLNERFQIEVARNLGLSDGPSAYVDDEAARKNVRRFDKNYMLVKRDPVSYANVEWARRVAPAFGSKRKIWVLLAEGRVDTSGCAKLPKNFVVKPLESPDVDVQSGDAVIVVAPGVTASWTRGYDIGAAAGAPVVFLNSQLSEKYQLGGPLADVEEVYYLKPVSKGFVYRAWPNPWEVWLDKPDGTQERLKVFSDERPTLGELSQITRSASQSKYGAIFNEKFTNDRSLGARL